MGKRKSKSRVITMKRPKLSKKFKCPFCCNDATCEVTFNKADAQAKIECRVCGEHYDTRITSLTEAVDVYTEWLDECEAMHASAAAGDEPDDPLADA